jgi:MerR family mercuric resistance operon transcriptional regulator
LQVQGLQRQPSLLQRQPWVWQPQPGALVSIVLVIVVSPFLALPESGSIAYGLRTMVRNQAKNAETIGGLARAAGVGVETVRYYQRRGLLPEPARARGEMRRYGEEELRRLRFIRSAQAAGFTLAEIGELLALSALDDRARARELAQARVAALDDKIAELQAARAALAGLADECASRRGGPCPILAAFEPTS